MRGIVTGDSDPALEPNDSGSEGTGDKLDLTPRGFKITTAGGAYNTDGNTHIYIAIRRSDGYVGKPPSLGTDVFAMDTGNGSTTIPAFDSNFPVDFAFIRQPATAQNWFASPRIMGDYYLLADTTAAQGSTSPSFDKDSNVGWAQNSVYNTDYQSWMWKRHAGFDCIAYKGSGSDRYINHSMNQAPEMMWFKKRNDAKNWYVYHLSLIHI